MTADARTARSGASVPICRPDDKRLADIGRLTSRELSFFFFFVPAEQLQRGGVERGRSRSGHERRRPFGRQGGNL